MVRRGTPDQRPILQIFWPADGYVKVSDETVGNGIDPTVDRELLAACPGVEHEDIRGHVSHLPNDIELARPIEACARVIYFIEFRTVRTVDLRDRM